MKKYKISFSDFFIAVMKKEGMGYYTTTNNGGKLYVCFCERVPPFMTLSYEYGTLIYNRV